MVVAIATLATLIIIIINRVVMKVLVWDSRTYRGGLSFVMGFIRRIINVIDRDRWQHGGDSKGSSSPWWSLRIHPFF